jgi:hypothetical protein
VPSIDAPSRDSLSNRIISNVRVVLSPWIPKLKTLSDEEISGEPIYRLLMLIAGLLLLYAFIGAIAYIITLLFYQTFIAFLPSAIAVFSGASLLLSGFAAVMIKVALDVRSRATAKAEDQKPANSTFRDVERIRLERDKAEESLFQKNVDVDFIFEAFEWSGISFFEDGRYRFAPRVNVLLGKNGYGKTLLLRSLVAIAQRNEQYSGLVFSKGAPSSQQASEAQSWLRLEVTRNGDTEQIFRDSTYFTDLVGKIPVLAIPDSRFVNRARRTVAGAAPASEPLVRAGAKHFLTQEPYEGVVQNLLTQLCLDYLEARRGRGFERPIFRLVEEVVEELTEDRDFRFADIKRAGTSQFEILVYTAGNLENPIPLQSASQGTLSIVAIFGLIYSFLRTLRSKLRTDRVLTAAATC